VIRVTVEELKIELEKLPDNAVVIISKDEEGNGFNELFCIEQCLFNGKDVFEHDDDDVNDELKDAVVLWP
jgi:hypothetical protein